MTTQQQKYKVFKEGVKLVALLQATLEQMDELKGTGLYKHTIKNKMRSLERDMEATLKGPLSALDDTDPELLTKIQYNIELVLGMDLEELAMLRQEIDNHRDNKNE
jgi:aspartokinase-like uncharacterized kinase